MIRLIEQELKRAVKAVWSPAVDAAGVTDRALAPALADRGRWTLLTFHRITERPDEDPYRSGMSVRAARFRAQLEWLVPRFDLRTVGDALRALRSGTVGPRPLLSITFDDGYLDNLRVAAPILRAVGVPASFYVTVGGLDTPPPFWWDRVTHAVRTGARRTPLSSAELELPGQTRSWSTAPMSRGALVESLLAELWRLPEHAVPKAVSAIERALCADPAPGPTLPSRMDRDQVRALHAQGFEIGAHSVEHVNLCLRDPVGMRAEMLESRAELERTLAAPVSGFAYPGGHLDEPVVECARACGFDYALTTLTGTNRKDTDPMRLRRVGAPDADLPDFKRAFARALDRDERTPRHAAA
ncbi:MAG: hypothetical protein RJA99_569 [Pseudomonadota bacterium]|jgi:peptidoglycan/xylan/chitin deacetylase (PgdA/CDA1 family)